jgi:hypothetical protein
MRNSGLLNNGFRLIGIVGIRDLWSVKSSFPATRHGGAWGRGGIAPTHSRHRH